MSVRIAVDWQQKAVGSAVARTSQDDRFGPARRTDERSTPLADRPRSAPPRILNFPTRESSKTGVGVAVARTERERPGQLDRGDGQIVGKKERTIGSWSVGWLALIWTRRVSNVSGCVSVGRHEIIPVCLLSSAAAATADSASFISASSQLLAAPERSTTKFH